mmetsp:Transcript_22952/g.76113  ORF Transcript_22952/g.76113 Transcript_22952/m.76113 type:complete len:427 (-) Transcript_22952:127-1407(-)
MTEHADTGDATPLPQRAAGRSYMQAELQQLAADARRAAAEAGLTLLRSHCSLSGYRGVLRDSDSTVGLKNPYRAQVRRGGRRVTLGRFATAEEAALCYARSSEGEAEARLAFDSERQPKAHGPRSSAQRALTPHSNVPERAKREGPRSKRKVKVLEGDAATGLLSLARGSPGRKPGVGNYSEDEDAAIKRRRTGGEAYSSIALSLGRSVNAVRTRGQRLMNPKFAPMGQGQAGVPRDRSINWVDEVASAMQRLPNQQGTAYDVIAVRKEMGHVLDESPVPGTRKIRGFSLVSDTLSKSRNPQFAALQRPARLGQSGTVVKVTHGGQGHKAHVQFQDGVVEAFSAGSLALAASPAARQIAAGASVTVTKEEGGAVKVNAGPGNAPCTVYKYRPELTPVKAVKSPAKRGGLTAKERKKGLDGVAQKNG